MRDIYEDHRQTSSFSIKMDIENYESVWPYDLKIIFFLFLKMKNYLKKFLTLFEKQLLTIKWNEKQFLENKWELFLPLFFIFKNSFLFFNLKIIFKNKFQKTWPNESHTYHKLLQKWNIFVEKSNSTKPKIIINQINTRMEKN